MDYIIWVHGEIVYGELKTRNCYSYDYPTTIIGKNKLDFLERRGRDGILLFDFIDGLYYVIASELRVGVNCYLNYNQRPDQGDFRFAPSWKVYINMSLLRPFSQFRW